MKSSHEPSEVDVQASSSQGESPATGHSLGTLAIRSASWTIVGQVISQALRLLSSIVLARLLFPEAFGLTAIVGVFLFGLAMLSDAGIGASIVQNKRGDETAFLQTAWTLQALRGLLISIFAVILAWPVSVFYNEPQLFALICVGALGPTLQGLNSISIHSHERNLNLGPVVKLELVVQIIQASITILWSLYDKSAWALVGGTLAGQAVHTALSHRILIRLEHRFCWDRETLRAIVKFGRWILLSSALTFFVLQTDRILLGYLLDLSILGVYVLGMRFIEALNLFQTRVTYSVLFPFFSQIGRGNPQELVHRYYHARLPMELLFLSASAFLMVMGDHVIHLVFDERYEQAGWMVQIIAVQTAMSLILTTQESLLFSLGHTYYGFLRSLAKAVWVVVGIPLGYSQMGLEGIVWCVALVEFPTLLVVWFGMVRYNLLKPILELRALSIFLGATLILFYLEQLL